MPTYNAAAVADAAIAHRKGISLQSGRALRDNPIAIIEGEPGAPRIVGKAIARLSSFPVLTVTASDLVNLSASNTVLQILSQTNTAVDVVAKRITIVSVTGAIRLKATHRTSDASATASLSLFKNNVLVQAYNTTNLLGVQRTVDENVAPGDVLEWRINSSNVSQTAFFENAVETASNGYVFAIPLIAFSEL